MFKEQLRQLLDRPVTRREFLGYIAVLFLAFVGVSALLRSVSELGGQRDPKKSLHSTLVTQSAGYGHSNYGI